LRGDGHVLTFKTVNDKPEIKYYDDFFYDNIILMAPSSALKDNISGPELINFIDQGHNVMVFSDESSDQTYHLFAN